MDDDINMGLVHIHRSVCSMDYRERLWISNRPNSCEGRAKRIYSVTPGHLFTSRRRDYEGSSSNVWITKSRPPAIIPTELWPTNLGVDSVQLDHIA
jgi:hypothetical protein